MPVELFIWPLEKPCRTNWLGSWIALVSLVVSELCALLEPQNGRKFALRSVKHTYLSLSLSIQFNVVFSFVCISFSEDDKVGTLDVLLSSAYCRSQRFLSKQLAQLRPELTMSIFSGKCRHLSLSVMSFYYYIYYIYHHISLVCRNYASLSERTWGCTRPAAAVPAALVAEYGAGRNECAARHAPIVYYGKWRRLMRGVKRGFSWYFHSLFNTALSETFCPSWKVKKAS